MGYRATRCAVRLLFSVGNLLLPTSCVESSDSFTPAVVMDGRCYLQLVVVFKSHSDDVAGNVTTTRFLSHAAAPGRADKLV